jgi:putative oxidoreductase
LVVAGHGSQKLFGWFGGPGLAGTSAWLGSMRMRPAGFWAVMAGLSEFGGGVLLALGFLNPLGSLGIVSAMLMAIILAHWPRFWAQNGGFEYPLVNLAAALGLAITGPGRYAVDSALGIAYSAPATLVVGLVLVLLGIATALGTRMPEQGTATAASPAHS